MSDEVILPNIRKLFVPDPNYVMFDCDLSGADAQVVAWEADDDVLKEAFRQGLDVHKKNAGDMWGREFLDLDPDSFAYYKKRQSCKHAVHGTNYGGSPGALSHHPAIGWPIAECAKFQERWFKLHPKIKEWHVRIQRQLDLNKTVTNSFGYRRVFFDRPDAVLPEALAWVPQSTVALVSFRGALQLESRYPQVEMLLQNHDSLVFQVPKGSGLTPRQLRDGLSVTCPYPDPLTIPWGIASSEVSWGDCSKVSETVEAV
jgi:DNA polymerase-1